MNYAEWRKTFEAEVERPAGEIDLARAALLIATDEYRELDVDAYLGTLDRMADALRQQLPSGGPAADCVQMLVAFLAGEVGLTGNREDYYDPRNSYLNDVIDRRTGLPITLSVVYLAVGSRLGLPLFGVGLPGHFIVKYEDNEQQILVDPFNNGAILDESSVEARVRDTFDSEARFDLAWLGSVDSRYILTRMLNNLKAGFVEKSNLARALKVVDKLLILNPRSGEDIRDMGLLSFQLGAFRTAANYLEQYILSHPDAEDANQVRIYLKTALMMVEKTN